MENMNKVKVNTLNTYTVLQQYVIITTQKQNSSIIIVHTHQKQHNKTIISITLIFSVMNKNHYQLKFSITTKKFIKLKRPLRQNIQY